MSEKTKARLLILLLFVSVILTVILVMVIRANKKLSRHLDAADEANGALQSEIDHYLGDDELEFYDNDLAADNNQLMPVLGGSLYYKIQVLGSNPPQWYHARIINKNYEIVIRWMQTEKKWSFDITRQVDGVNAAQVLSCDFSDSASLQKEINRILKEGINPETEHG